jgi:trimeric autotransporter adhesin
MRVFIRMMLPCFFYAQMSLNAFAQSGIITTVVGSGSPVNVALATTERLDHPGSIALDGVGGFYISSAYKHRIHHVTADGRLRLAAGVGIPGYSGDGGQATSAQLCHPSGVAIDSAGNLYIADGGNHRIRRVTPAGVITTIAGNGTGGFSGDGGKATSAQLSTASVAMDSTGNLYIADSENHRIRKVAPTGLIATVAGNGTNGFSGDGSKATSAQLNWPTSVATDSAGNLYFIDKLNHRVRKMTPAGVINTIAGNGTIGYSGDNGQATFAQLNLPYGIAVDTAGNLYISDGENHRIRKVTPAGMITTVAGNGIKGFSGDGGKATSAQLNKPAGVVVDSADNLYIADTKNFCIRKVTPAGLITTIAGGNGNERALFGSDSGQAASAKLCNPSGVSADSAGNLYIADTKNFRIRKITPAGVITTVAGNGFYGYGGDGSLATSAQLAVPQGVAVDSTGNLYIADIDNNCIRKVTSAGLITTVDGTQKGGFSRLLHFLKELPTGDRIKIRGEGPQGVAVDSAGNLYIADTFDYRIRKVTPAGKITTIAGNGEKGYSGDGGKATSARLGPPSGVAVDSAGNIYIADTHNARIRKVTRTGVITTIAGNGNHGYSGDGGQAASAQLSWPHSVAVDSSGNLYIADTQNNRIRKVTPAGLITTVAGDGNEGYDGDGGMATSALLRWPEGLALDPAGNLFIADTGNNCIRKVAPASR